MALWAFTGPGRHLAWPSVATLSKMVQKSPRVVQRALRDLEEAHLIELQPDTDGRRIYQLRGGDAHDAGGDVDVAGGDAHVTLTSHVRGDAHVTGG